MIRKRDQFEEPFIFQIQHEDEADPKKRRLTGADEEDNSEGVINKCLTFLINLSPPSRPKTPEKLFRTLQKLCTFTYLVDPNIVFFHLILNQLILPLEADGTNCITVNPNPPPRPPNQLVVAIPTNSTSNRVSNDFREALLKAVAWVRTNRGLQGKTIANEHFLKSLEQVCMLKKQANPEVVVQHLLKRGMVRVDPEGGLSYDLPLESSGSHYMAMVVNVQV
eukprot:TRINITY_DN325_c0_g4_i1.p1 TRINITY_DN325_c0_g4~~TRINITY_DN325_c0_g4_i1.p1  ORF type:complete len:222 (+),score=35.29 TRINITY_DN325_c0_g4_i1:203-868(+)